MSGAGTQGGGLSPAGLGDPAEGDEDNGKLFRDQYSGEGLSGRLIDQRTGRYTFDSYGRILGMSTGQQKVLLAVKTDLGSSAVAELGNRLRSIQKIGVGFERELQDVYSQALARPINAGEVELISVTPQRVGTSGAFVLVRFRDLTTDTEYTVRN